MSVEGRVIVIRQGIIAWVIIVQHVLLATKVLVIIVVGPSL